ncbi:hypothetical protein [Streptomyces sp. NPDC020817]|uniref:hypothetical protein n=1 Tax=Streptomyces sp. NPDC020817 TaxID=3365095 RepID=UPI0037B57000
MRLPDSMEPRDLQEIGSLKLRRPWAGRLLLTHDGSGWHISHTDAAPEDGITLAGGEFRGIDGRRFGACVGRQDPTDIGVRRTDGQRRGRCAAHALGTDDGAHRGWRNGSVGQREHHGRGPVGCEVAVQGPRGGSRPAMSRSAGSRTTNTPFSVTLKGSTAVHRLHDHMHSVA